jgi:hypothetical protein
VNWVNIVLPIVTLIVGSGLTLLGQALGDRRKEASDIRARKEQFKIGNFEMHRAAMLELQEIVRDLANALIAEEIRRMDSDEREFFETSRSVPRDQMSVLNEHLEWLNGVNVPVKGASEEEKRAFTEGVRMRSSQFAEVSEKMTDYVGESRKYFEERGPFYDEMVKFINNMRLRMYRSGSNTVVRYGEEYIQAVAKWNDLLVSEGSDELLEEAREARFRLDRALSNALTYGPFDKFTGDN